MSDTNVRDELGQFLENNKPTRFYKIKRRVSLHIGRWSIELRLLKDEQ